MKYDIAERSIFSHRVQRLQQIVVMSFVVKYQRFFDVDNGFVFVSAQMISVHHDHFFTMCTPNACTSTADRTETAQYNVFEKSINFSNRSAN